MFQPPRTKLICLLLLQKTVSPFQASSKLSAAEVIEVTLFTSGPHELQRVKSLMLVQRDFLANCVLDFRL